MTKRTTTLAGQPSAQRILKLIGRARGASTAELMKATGWVSHSVRGLISRLGAEGIKFERIWVQGRGRVYRIERFSGPKDATRLTKRQSAKLAARGGFKAPRVAR